MKFLIKSKIPNQRLEFMSSKISKFTILPIFLTNLYKINQFQLNILICTIQYCFLL